MSRANKDSMPGDNRNEQHVSFFSAWCKRCGNCVAFCPRQALGHDKWNHPVLIYPKRFTSCGLCEMLCPDFAISVGEIGLNVDKDELTSNIKQPTFTDTPERLASESSFENNKKSPV